MSEATFMWPYQSLKPVSWERYYAHDLNDDQASVTSGLAAGLTIGIFFAVFLLTIGCRLYGRRRGEHFHSDNLESSHTFSNRWYSVTDLYCAPAPPPPYEVAIRMPPQGDPPPFSENPEVPMANARLERRSDSIS